MNQQHYNILLLTNLDTYNLINNCIQQIPHHNQYQITWLSDDYQWQTTYSEQPSQLDIVESQFF